MSNQLTSDLEIHLQANCPVIYVVSPEEERFIGTLEKTCIRLRRRLWVFTISEGLRNIAFSGTEGRTGSSKTRTMDQLRDPISVLEHIKKAGPEEGVFLLLDFHEFLGDAQVRRLIRDLSRCLRETRKSIAILAPVLELPRELEHEVSVLDFPLPGREELRQRLESALMALRVRKVRIEINEGEKERLIIASGGLTMVEFEDCLAKAVVRRKGVDPVVIEDVIREKKQIIRKSGLLEFFDTGENLDQVGGLGALKKWLAKRQFAFSEKARAFGLPYPKGIVLLGVQGCGKSLTAKACSALWKFPLLRLDTGRLFSSRVGSSEENTRQAIRISEALAPCVLWLDEIDKAMAGIGSSSYSDAGTTARVLATLATWLQEKTVPVFVIATANSVTSLPPELLRKGRWDEIFFLDLPGEAERKTILTIHLTKRHRNPEDFDLPILAGKCPGFSGAEIEQAVIASLYDAFDEDRPMTTEDILRNLREQVPLSKTMAEQVEALRTWALTRARFASDESENMLEEQKKRWRSRDLRKI